ncbi:MAG: hypothetical protein P8X60_04625, partial [Robiginitalea sp.]
LIGYEIICIPHIGSEASDKVVEIRIQGLYIFSQKSCGPWFQGAEWVFCVKVGWSPQPLYDIGHA